MALIGVVALIVIGPEKLPKVARTLGALLGKAQRYVSDVKAEVNRSMDLEELKKMKETMETAARDVEQTVIQDLTGQNSGVVLATGGGSVLREANRQRLRAHTHVVYLRSSPEQVFQRVRHNRNRPLLQVDDPLERLRALGLPQRAQGDAQTTELLRHDDLLGVGRA